MRPLIALFLAACADPITITTLDDEGSACVEDGQITVHFPGCLSSSCDTLVESTCTATLDGTTLTVTGHAEIHSQGQTCTADCGMITATCDAPEGFDPATMTLAYAGEEGPPATCEAIP